MKNRWLIIGIAAGSLLFLLLGTILPMTTTQVFASPDETAVAAFARGWSWSHGFTLTPADSRKWDFVVHPRSMVQEVDRLEPVGFLGMPILILPFEMLRKGFGSFLTVIIIASSAFALFCLVKPLGKNAAWTAVIVYLSFPTVLLYTNRSLFPNLPVVALGLWAVYLIRSRKESWAEILSGVALGFALIIRPVEALWLVPWVLWAGHIRFFNRDHIRIKTATIIVCLLGYLMAVLTYRTWLPLIGYWLSDMAPKASTVQTLGATETMKSDGFLDIVRSVLPFGIHPRALLSNIQVFLFGILGPWVAAAMAGVALWMWKRRDHLNVFVTPLVLSGWTVFVLLFMYGQARYMDNINGTATLGNSFLRYLLPLAPLIAVGIGLLVEELSKIAFRWKVCAIGLVIFFAIFGVVTALMRDEEAIIPTRGQLVRAEYIRDVAQGLLPPGAVVLSERSDKIFVGTGFMAVSPMPDNAIIEQLKASGEPLALFHRILTDDQRQSFAGGAFEDWLLASVFDNEALYIPPKTVPLSP